MVLILGALLKRQHKHPGAEGDQGAQEHSHQAKPEAPSHALRHYNHPSEEEHRTAEQFNWRDGYRLNVGIAVVAVIGALFAFGSFIETRRQANIAHDALVAGARAWMDITIDPSSASLDWMDGVKPAVAANVALNNQGASPALDADPFIAIDFSYIGATDFKSTLRNVCLGERVSLTHKTIFFPKSDPVPIGTVALAERGAVTDAIRRYDKAIPDHTFGVGFFWMSVIVCVRYKIVGDERLHFTGRVYALVKPAPKGAPKIFYTPRIGVPFKAGEVALIAEPGASDAN